MTKSERTEKRLKQLSVEPIFYYEGTTTVCLLRNSNLLSLRPVLQESRTGKGAWKSYECSYTAEDKWIYLATTVWASQASRAITARASHLGVMADLRMQVPVSAKPNG